MLLDGSEEMLAQAASGFRRPRSIQGDMRDGLPDGPFDAVVSSLAIHHLEHDEQRKLYAGGRGAAAARRRVRERRAHPGADAVAGDGGRARAGGRAAAAAGASEAELVASDGRMELNRCATTAQCLGWLEAAGLEDCECFFEQFYFAVLAGWRPA